jgi:hypothetical protein
MEIPRYLRIGVCFTAVVSTVAVAQVTDCTLLTFSEQVGTLPDGMPYGLRKPSDWNGVLINDLDYLPNRDSQSRIRALGHATPSVAHFPVRPGRRRSKIS